jgi:hypothetical protein
VSKVPDDLRVALAAGYVRENFKSGEPWSETIARATLAERQRCAEVARNMDNSAYGLHSGADIADAILGT